MERRNEAKAAPTTGELYQVGSRVDGVLYFLHPKPWRCAVRLRLVRLKPPEEGFSVAIEDAAGQWQPLRPALRRLAAAEQFPTLNTTAHDVIGFLQAGAAARDEAHALLERIAREGMDLSDTFDPAPRLPFQPLSFRDFMLYEQHFIDAAKGMVQRFMPEKMRFIRLYERVFGKPPKALRPKPIWYEKPIYYMGSHINFFGEGDEIPWPSYTRALDYELELGVVIAQPLRDATPQEAEAAIGGFVVVNDFSARDVQYPEMTSGFGPVKAKNFANAMGAVVVTADEILPRVEALRGEVRVNGELWGQGSTAGMQHTLGEMVAYASLGESVLPGELMATGTLPGCSGMETNHWLRPGDRITLTIQGVGSLTNLIGHPQASAR